MNVKFRDQQRKQFNDVASRSYVYLYKNNDNEY